MNDVNMIEENDDEIQIETASSVSISCTSSLTPKKKKGVFFAKNDCRLMDIRRGYKK